MFETTNDGINENDQNNDNIKSIRSNSVDSNNLSSDCDDVNAKPITSKKANKAQPKPSGPKKCASTKFNVPDVYFKAELMKRKHEHQAMLREKEEREKRMFHAKRAPDFKTIHAAHAVKQNRVDGDKIEKLTQPVTPKVVHHHRKYSELVKIKVRI